MMPHSLFRSVEALANPGTKVSSSSAGRPLEHAASGVLERHGTLSNMSLEHEHQYARDVTAQAMLDRALLRKQWMAEQQNSQLSAASPLLEGRGLLFGAAEQAELDAYVRHRQEQALMSSNTRMHQEYAALLRQRDHQARLSATLGVSHNLGLRGHPASLGVSSLTSHSSVLEKLQRQQDAILEQQAFEEASLRNALFGRAQESLSGDYASFRGAFPHCPPISGAHLHETDAMLHSLLLQREAEYTFMLGNRQDAWSQQHPLLTRRAAPEPKLSGVVAEDKALRAVQQQCSLADDHEHRRLMDDERLVRQRRSSVAPPISASQRSVKSANLAPVTASAPPSTSSSSSTYGRDDVVGVNKGSKKKRFMAAAAAAATETRQKSSPRLSSKPETASTSRQDTEEKAKNFSSTLGTDNAWEQTTLKIMKIDDYSEEGLDFVDKAASTKRKFKTKDHDMPKRPLSAYNLFFKDQRARLVQEQEEKDAETRNGGRKKGAGPGLGFENLAKVIALKWKTVDETSLDKYKRLARTDAERYRQEMEQYRERFRSQNGVKRCKTSACNYDK